MEENHQQDQHDLDVETVSKAQYDTVVAELDDIKSKLPKEPTEDEKALAVREQELWQREKEVELKAVGLDKFTDYFNATNKEDLSNQAKQFQTLLNEVKASMGYVPADHKKEDVYNTYEQKKDTKNMIGHKLANLFK